MMTENRAVSSVKDKEKPRILLMGLRRSGKSSIVRVVFQKMSPHETLFLESTSRIVRSEIANNSFVQFQVWDFPGQIDFFDNSFDSDAMFAGCGALIFVVDAQDDYAEAVSRLVKTVQKARAISPNIVFEVFIHKVDGLGEDHKVETQRDIQQTVQEELMDAQIPVDSVAINYHLTSIYDHTIFEAFSKVVQKLIPQLPTLANLMDIFVQSSRVEKAFLFDVVSKIYIATDSSPVDNTTFELCSDMIDVALDVSLIYSPANLVMASEERDTAAAATGTADQGSSSVIKLSNHMVLYLREVNRYLALVCLLRQESFDKLGLIEYNFSCFKDAVSQVFSAQKRQTGQKR